MKKLLITVAAVACATFELAAMPTKEEAERAKPLVRKMLESEWAALNSGTKTRSEVAGAAMKLAGETDTDAAKLLLMKGAFVLYVRDGNLEKAVETANTLERTIADMPAQSVTNMIDLALLGVSKKEDGPRLYRLLDAAKKDVAKMQPIAKKPLETKEREENATERTRKAVAKLFPGWSLDTEVEQNELCGFHASHRGQANVVCVHPKSMRTPAILSRTVTLSDRNPCLFLKVASFDEQSDFLLSVRVNGKDALSNRRINTPDCAPWEDLVVPLSDWRGSEAKIEVVFTANGWHARWPENPYLARMEIAEGKCDMRIVEGKVTVDDYTWSYRAQNGEATIIAEKDGNCTCAVWPNPKGDLVIPSTLDGFRVTSIGTCAFAGCGELKSVTIPSGVKRIMWCAFYGCKALTSVVIPSGVKSVEHGAFTQCEALSSVAIPESVTFIGREAFRWCGALESVKLPSGLKVLERGVVASTGLKSVTIPPNVKSVERGAVAGCTELELVMIPESVTNIGIDAFRGSGRIKSVAIPSSVRTIADNAFSDCGELVSVTMCGEKPESGKDLFKGSGKLKDIHVSAKAKSWKGMKEWQGIPLVFD